MTDLHSSVYLILIYTYDNIYILRLVYIGGEIYVLIIYLCECRYYIGVYRWPFPNQVKVPYINTAIRRDRI